MAAFALKIKWESGQKVLTGLYPVDKVYNFKRKLSDIIGVYDKTLHVLGGFPPKALDFSNDDATLQEIGIVPGDTLIICINEQMSDDRPRPHVINSEGLTNSPGVLMKKDVPADNSCLFTSVGYVLNGKVDPSCASFMREIIANVVASEKEEYSEAILGRPNAEYCEWIQKPDTWGGAIELSILSQFYGLEIAVVDSINAIVNRFGEDQHYAQRVFLMFDGIHYDPLYLESFDGENIQTIFPAVDERLLIEAAELAKEARSSRQYTNVQTFTLKCMVCDVMLNGQVAAQQHAKDTGHMNFGEVAA